MTKNRLRRLAVLGALMVACLALASVKPLSDVQNYLKKAQTALQQGSFREAIGYARLILLDQEIRVYVDSSKIDSADAPHVEEAIQKALGTWERALDREVDFTFANEPKGAHITIRPERNVVSGGQVAGNVQWSRKMKVTSDGEYQPNVTATIKIRTRDLSGNPMTENQMAHIVMHEMGHVLGLADVEEYGCIMSPLDMNKPVTTPTREELRVLVDLRRDAASVRDAAVARIEQARK